MAAILPFKVNHRLIAFNVVYYLTTLTFYFQGLSDPSSSLGYGFFILGFWVLSLIVLVLLVVRSKILVNNVWDKIGIILATPIPVLVIIGTGLAITDQVDSERYTYKDGYQYKILEYSDRSTSLRTRTEIYKSEMKVAESSTNYNINWLRDSTWAYYSNSGDTIKIEKYVNDKRIE
ncbi:MAG: hypothetical protein JNL40_02255 [Cyclobacteriaceae bacterium]|nr:hypothetical protein [Cyclobacteriaceae bacterium]